jgi:hypothetical protein
MFVYTFTPDNGTDTITIVAADKAGFYARLGDELGRRGKTIAASSVGPDVWDRDTYLGHVVTAPADHVYTVKGNRSTVHIAGVAERTSGAGAERGGVVGYYAQSACAGLTRSGHRMETIGNYVDLAEAVKRAEQATYAISGRKVCKTCLAAVEATEHRA